jgi:membrane protease YdiL (CAAX protease family)
MWALAAAGDLSNAFAEETINRSWLMTRLTLLLRSRLAAVAISTAAFTSYHIYQGPAALPFIALYGLIFGAAFALSRRIWPCVAGHALVNLLLTL